MMQHAESAAMCRRGESNREQEVLRNEQGRTGPNSIVMQRRNIRMQGSGLAMSIPVML